MVDVGTDCDNGGDGDDAEEAVVGGDFIIVRQTVYLDEYMVYGMGFLCGVRDD